MVPDTVAPYPSSPSSFSSLKPLSGMRCFANFSEKVIKFRYHTIKNGVVEEFTRLYMVAVPLLDLWRCKMQWPLTLRLVAGWLMWPCQTSC